MKFETKNIRTLTVNGTDREYDISTLPDNVLDYVIDYGLRQTLNDSYASALERACPDDVTKDLEGDALKRARREWGKANESIVDQEREALLSAKWERLQAGEIRAAGGGKASLSPLEKMTYTVAREWLKADMRAKGIEMKRFTGKTPEEQFEVLDQYIANDPDSVTAEAEKRLAAIKTAVNAKVDIASLL